MRRYSNRADGNEELVGAYKGESGLISETVGGTTALGFINLPSALPLIVDERGVFNQS